MGGLVLGEGGGLEGGVRVKGRVKIMWRIRVRVGLGLERTTIEGGGAPYRVEEPYRGSTIRRGWSTWGERK